MRLRTLLLAAAALLTLVHATGIDGSFDSVGASDESDHADDAIFPSPRAEQGATLAVGTDATLRDGSMLSHVPRPRPVLTGRPRTGGLRPMQPTLQAPPSSPVQAESVLVPQRAQPLEKGKGKLRRSRGQDKDEDRSPPQRAEGQGRRRLRQGRDSAGRARKMRQTDTGSSRERVEQMSSPTAQRAAMPAPQPMIVPGISMADATGHAQQAAPPNAATDAFLPNLFNSYLSFPQPGPSSQPHTFNYHGLRYGHFPATEPLRELPAPPFRDAQAGMASVLRPSDMRWTFGQEENRRGAYQMARSRSNTVAARTVMANEAKRLYEVEADKIREAIDRHEFPLDTSDEWRSWVSQEGVSVLLSQIDPSKMIGLNPLAVYGRDRLAVKIHGSDLAEQAMIPLHDKHEEWAAKFLVAWWTAYHNRLLRTGLV
ncbi:hypothetical protein EX895_005187 [Sporisorium graminicola]|uniref:Uncharacterized protein n=1 Tax=Sporisorium graminicola TaxID=280036 RepID=A0A4U7KR31_9BASI|nr:hypothetical protein EX895_005187 [Sporisorium graminicola]TKY85648.1 hypothetical protein EX895_005187 [Sporisorium graminicola]